MTNSVHVLPVNRKPGRRRSRPIPGAFVAPIVKLTLVEPTETIETAEQRLAKIEQLLPQLAHNILEASRTARELWGLLPPR